MIENYVLILFTCLIYWNIRQDKLFFKGGQ